MNQLLGKKQADTFAVVLDTARVSAYGFPPLAPIADIVWLIWETSEVSYYLERNEPCRSSAAFFATPESEISQERMQRTGSLGCDDFLQCLETDKGL
jgi:hypothetical protein